MIYTKSPKSKKHKVPKVQKEQYDAWLKSRPPPKPPKPPPPKSIPPGRETPHYPSLNTGFTGTLSKVGIMNDYYKMSKEDQAKVDEVNSCVAPMHKSNYIYVSAGINPAGLGRKNEVL